MSGVILPDAWNPEWVRLERKQQQLTQAELARQSGLNEANVRSAESSDVRLRTIVPILRALKQTLGTMAEKGAIYELTGMWPETIRFRAETAS